MLSQVSSCPFCLSSMHFLCIYTLARTVMVCLRPAGACACERNCSTYDCIHNKKRTWVTKLGHRTHTSGTGRGGDCTDHVFCGVMRRGHFACNTREYGYKGL